SDTFSSYENCTNSHYWQIFWANGMWTCVEFTISRPLYYDYFNVIERENGKTYKLSLESFLIMTTIFHIFCLKMIQRLFIVHFQYSHESFLWHFNRTYHLHTFLTFFLFLE